MLTDRDTQVLSFLEEFHVATTSTLQSLFYPSTRVSQRRLKVLTEYGYLKRERSHIDTEYIYYLKKPKQIRHCLLRTEFLKVLHSLDNVKIIKYMCEFDKFEGLRPDAFIVIKVNGSYMLIFLEVEISSKGLDMEKYRKLYLTEKYKEYFDTFPVVVVISNRKIRCKEEFRIVQIREDMSNIGDLFSKV